MSQKMSMAELLAKQDKKTITLTRGQQLSGTVIAILSQEIILDLGTKAEGSLLKKELPPTQLESLKVGDSLEVVVIAAESESGQAILSVPNRRESQSSSSLAKWSRFEQARDNNETLKGKGLEVNKGGLVVEVNGVRGFLPSSQIGSSEAANLDQLIGKDLNVLVIEVDSSQNRLIFSQKSNLTDEAKTKITQLKIGDKINGKVAAILPFGMFITLENGVEGMVHISEIAWEKVDDIAKLYKVGDQVESQVISIDKSSGRINLSLKQLAQDPFMEVSKKYAQDDIVKGTVSKLTNMGAYITLENGVEGLMPTSKFEAGTEYKVGQELTCTVDSIDLQKRRINLVPFITTTSGLIYK